VTFIWLQYITVACACKTLHYLNLLLAFIRDYSEEIRWRNLIQPSNRHYKPSNRHVIQQALQELRLRFQMSTCERAYSLRAVWPSEEVEINRCLPFRCLHAIAIMQILNWTYQCSLFMTVRYILRSARMTPRTVTHGHDYWWTIDFANVFLFLKKFPVCI
jgi:hypothetical protein